MAVRPRPGGDPAARRARGRARGPGAAAGQALPAGPLRDVLAEVDSALDHTLAGRPARDLVERGEKPGGEAASDPADASDRSFNGL